MKLSYNEAELVWTMKDPIFQIKLGIKSNHDIKTTTWSGEECTKSLLLLLPLTILRLENVVTRCHVLSSDAQLGGVGGRAVSVHLQHKHTQL